LSPPNTFYSALLMLSGGVCLFVGAIIFRPRRIVNGTFSLLALLSALAWWDITYAFFWAGMPASTPYFWLDITYVGVVIVPVALFIFTLQISNRSKWLRRPVKALLYGVPAIVLLALFTDPYHGLFFGAERPENSGFILNAGPVFWFNVAFSYILILAATVVLILAYQNSAGMYRKQIGLVLFGMAVTWLNSIIFVMGIRLLPGADNTPFSFTIAALAFAFALLRFHLLDVVPVARDLLVERMSDGLLVIDEQNRVVDINKTARRLLKISRDVIGRSSDEVFAHWEPAHLKALHTPDAHFEIEVVGNPATYLEANVTLLPGKKGRLAGRLVLFHNITNLKDVQNELRYLARHDPLTGSVNRRYFMELAHKELLRARRYQRPLSLVLIDLDEFKKVNDMHGHQAGDQALMILKGICDQGIRAMDVFARLGGEEFALLLPETDQDAAYLIAERLRDMLEKTTIKSGSHRFKVTMSMGVTEIHRHKDETIDTMLTRADRALYRAKAGGRNLVLRWQAEGKENHHEGHQHQRRPKTHTGK